MALSQLLQDLDDAVTALEQADADAAMKAQEASVAQAAADAAKQVVVDLQGKLQERLGPMVGNARVRQS